MQEAVKARPFSSTDRQDCIEIFRSNVPNFFHETEFQEFVEFIDDESNPYFVIEDKSQIVGCGGYGFRDGGDTADLCWGMIHSGHHGRRLGEFLLLVRMKDVLDHHDIEAFRVATSQHTEAFFAGYGFEAYKKETDGFAPGLDLIEMKLPLSDTMLQRLERRFRVLFQTK